MLSARCLLLLLLAHSLRAQSTTGRNASKETAYEQCIEQARLGHPVASCSGRSVPKIFRGEEPGRTPIHFLHIPKAAGRSIELLLGKHEQQPLTEATKLLNCSFWYCHL